MPTIGIEVDTAEDEAQERASGNPGTAIEQQEVTDDGNFYREMEVPLTLYEKFLDKAEEDQEVQVKSVSI
jgi:hypothetical protein